MSSPLGSEPVNRPSPYILIGGVVLALLALVVWLLYTFTGAGGEPQARIDGLYHRIRRTLAWAGVSAPPSQTPDEFLSNCTDRLRPYRQLSQAVWQATLLYRETVYSPRLPDEQHLRAANRLWQHSFSDWLALWLKFRWARLRDRH